MQKHRPSSPAPLYTRSKCEADEKLSSALVTARSRLLDSATTFWLVCCSVCCPKQNPMQPDSHRPNSRIVENRPRHIHRAPVLSSESVARICPVITRVQTRPQSATALHCLCNPRTGVASGSRPRCRHVRSRCRCSMCLQFALSHAVGCAFHRPMSRVIHRSE